MPGKYERYSSGQRMPLPSAAQLNAWTDAAEDYAKRRKQGIPAIPIGGPRDTDVIRVRNVTGADRQAGEVLRIGAKIIDDLDPFHIWHEGSLYGGTGCYGILIRPTPADGIDQLQVSGVCLAWVTITNETHCSAKAKAGSYLLESAADGPIGILYRDGTGEGDMLCVVNIGPTCCALPETMYVRAIECALIGADGDAQPQRYNAATNKYEDDPDRYPVTVRDPNCERVAVGTNDPSWKDESDIYRVVRLAGTSTYIPASPFGLVRMVRFEEEIQCGQLGSGYLLRKQYPHDPEVPSCQWLKTTCQVVACNRANRRIAPDAREEAWVHWHEGDCVGAIVPRPRPLTARATLASATCGVVVAPSGVNITGIEYFGFSGSTSEAVGSSCVWEHYIVPESVTNSIGLVGSAGDKVLLAWDDTNKKWDIIAIQPYLIDTYITDVRFDSCALEKRIRRLQVAVGVCDNTIHDSGWETVTSGVAETVVTDVSVDETGYWAIERTDVLVLCAGEPVVSVTSIPFCCEGYPPTGDCVQCEEFGFGIPSLRAIFSGDLSGECTLTWGTDVGDHPTATHGYKGVLTCGEYTHEIYLVCEYNPTSGAYLNFTFFWDSYVNLIGGWTYPDPAADTCEDITIPSTFELFGEMTDANGFCGGDGSNDIDIKFTNDGA